MTDIVERLRGWGSVMCVEAADEIERLRQGRETMGNLWAREREARYAAEGEIEYLRETYRNANERCCELLEENLRMRTALEPFAKEADRYEPDEGDDDVRAWGSSFPICYLRRARQACLYEKAASKETASPTA
jgi:hypothetical protein